MAVQVDEGLESVALGADAAFSAQRKRWENNTYKETTTGLSSVKSEWSATSVSA